ncbi:hypothetical protein KBB12_00805 [Candidatus Woesebacteria bacterium]|nr:hypothetical protein [Candidatus Woesebacteria bacterium]
MTTDSNQLLGAHTVEARCHSYPQASHELCARNKVKAGVAELTKAAEEAGYSVKEGKLQGGFCGKQSDCTFCIQDSIFSQAVTVTDR